MKQQSQGQMNVEIKANNVKITTYLKIKAIPYTTITLRNSNCQYAKENEQTNGCLRNDYILPSYD